MGKIEEIKINEERIFLKKNNLLGWSVVHPNKIDGKLDWKNLIIGGNWVKFFFIIGFLLLLVLAMFEYSSIVKTANECLQALNEQGGLLQGGIKFS